jgi:hypothetical protein
MDLIQKLSQRQDLTQITLEKAGIKLELRR